VKDRLRFSDAPWFLPASILLLAIVAYPIARTLLLSLLHLNLATGFQTETAGIDNFSRLVNDSRFGSSLRVTALFTAVSVGAEFALGLLLALAMNALKTARALVRVIFLVPWTLPTAVIAVLWAWIFNDQYGILNGLLIRTGVMDSAVAWLAQPGTAMLSIVVADVWKTTPFVFLILLAGLQNIPQELYEAIRIDGGGSWAAFRYVTWPHLMPFVFVALIFRIVQAFAIFDLVWVMTGGGPGGATETVSIYTYQTYMRYLDFGYGAAMVVATVVILGAVATLFYRFLLVRYERLF
jgi:multiple sugar transport system permease protein